MSNLKENRQTNWNGVVLNNQRGGGCEILKLIDTDYRFIRYAILIVLIKETNFENFQLHVYIFNYTCTFLTSRLHVQLHVYFLNYTCTLHEMKVTVHPHRHTDLSPYNRLAKWTPFYSQLYSLIFCKASSRSIYLERYFKDESGLILVAPFSAKNYLILVFNSYCPWIVIL